MQSRPHGQCRTDSSATSQRRRHRRPTHVVPRSFVPAGLRQSATECDTNATILPPPARPDVHQARAGTRQQQARTVTTAVIPTTEHLSASIRRFPYLFWAPGTSFRHPHVLFDIFRSIRNFPRQSETFPVDAYLTRTVPVDTNPTFVQLPGECRQLPAAVVRRSRQDTSCRHPWSHRRVSPPPPPSLDNTASSSPT